MNEKIESMSREIGLKDEEYRELLMRIEEKDAVIYHLEKD
jgi:hypothetical protein